eukprot:TRINITY_DN56623_c0_g1_i1.p1 TRINITY_DN56623_c0_g1~~TRINITY_DN56623_c0_g1_i1.p1  ORF type:complete len:464 (+),score=120.56 TRINITY_DN56623_c0_g1_i1:83-1474(+)
MEKYKEVRKLAGSQGDVVIVANTVDRRHYVLKSVELQTMKPQDRERAKRECEILIRLRHPNIVKYVESVTYAGRQCIVMEYASGGTVEDHLVRRRKGGEGPVPEKTVLRWFGQLCRALEHCHEHKVLHRNIKLSNIFLSKGGDNALLGDFGLARMLESTMAMAQTTVGSPMSMSPEAIQGKPYSHASDVWSLGCVLFELCTLQHPFKSDTLRDLMEKILRAPTPELPPGAAELPRRLVPMLLEKRPERRIGLRELLRIPELQVAAIPSAPPGGVPGRLEDGDEEDTEEWAGRLQAQLDAVRCYIDGMRAEDALAVAAEVAKQLQAPPRAAGEAKQGARPRVPAAAPAPSRQQGAAQGQRGQKGAPASKPTAARDAARRAGPRAGPAPAAAPTAAARQRSPAAQAPSAAGRQAKAQPKLDAGGKAPQRGAPAREDKKDKPGSPGSPVSPHCVRPPAAGYSSRLV